MKKQTGVSEDRSLQLLISIDTRITNIEEQLSDVNTRMATKDDLAELEAKLLVEIHALGRAVDQDALRIIDHQKRIVRLEKHPLLK